MGTTCFWKENVSSIVVAEALVALEAVRFARDLGFRSVEFEEDSTIVFAKLTSLKTNRSEVSSYIWDTKHLVVAFEHFKFQHIKREGGIELLAFLPREGVLQKLDICWIEDGPTSTQVDLVREVS